MSRMFLIGLLVCSALLACSAVATAAPYPLGSMTCADIGKFASEAMAWRKEGQSKDQALAALEKRSYNDLVEKKNLTMILDLVFGSYGRNWSVESAGNVMRTDCETGR